MLRTGCADVVRSQTSQGRVATTPVSASIVGAIQAQEGMKIIHLDEYPDGKLPFTTLQGKMFRYEGLTNTVNTYRFASWKKNCPAHEQWENPLQSSLSAKHTVKHVLEELKRICGTDMIEINMMNNKFVRRIISDKPEKEFEVMIPESKLDDYISANAELRKLSYKTVFHKDFYENIDDSFPFPEMTLESIGIPMYDVLRVSTNKGMFYIELSADAQNF